jgi:hypothetical protein
VTKQDKEDGTSLFMTSSSESATSSDSSSDSSSSEEDRNESPEKKRVKRSRLKGQKKEKKRASRNELTASFAHERGQVGLALQQQHHLLSNVSERLTSHSETLDQLTQELVAVRARAEEARKKREEEFRQREVDRQKMLEDSRRREEGYKRMISESELRASARANEKKEMLSGLNNYAAIQRARLDVLRKDKRQDRCERMKRKRAEQKRNARKAKTFRQYLTDQGSGLRAASLQGEKKCQPEMESALDQRTRLALENKHHHLTAEIRRLEAIKMTRWKELLDLNLWHTHDEDNTVKELDMEIDEYRKEQRNITTLIDAHKEKMEERNRGMNRLV